jgi:hypothetical protein
MANSFAADVGGMRTLMSGSTISGSFQGILSGQYAGTEGTLAEIEQINPGALKSWERIIRMDSVRSAVLNLLRTYSRKARALLLQPTAEWEHKPQIEAGLAGKFTKGGMPSMISFSRGTGEMSAGAFVTAAGEHTPWLAGRGTDNKGNDIREVNQNDANWHYIWANNGTSTYVITPTATGAVVAAMLGKSRGRSGKLVFKDGYTPATSGKAGTLQVLTGGRAARFGKDCAMDSVEHTTEPRRFDLAVVAALENKFYVEMALTIRDGIEKELAKPASTK